MVKTLLTAWLLCIAFLLSAQRSATELAVRGLFEQPEKISWFRYYKGRVDDLNDISVSLAFDGASCKGFLTYLRSKERFRLEGSLSDDHQLSLKEYDKGGLVSGYFVGQINVDNLEAEWSNYNYSVGGRMSLKHVEGEPRLPSYCGDNKWIRQYEGVLERQPFIMILQRTNNGMLQGTAYSATKSYMLRGQINEYQQLEIDLKDEKSANIGSFKGSHAEATDLKGNFVNSSGGMSIADFKLLNQLDIGCIEYADYITSYDITYPKTKNAAFNQWMDKQAMNWVVACRNRVQKIKTTHPRKTPYLRASERGYAWTEIFYLTPELISGYLHFSNTWSEENQTLMINFDLKSGKPLLIDDILKGKYKKFIRNQIKKNYKTNRYYDQEDFKKWVLREGFTLFSLRNDGIYFSTKFNPIYGQQHILIPYKAMKPYLRKNTVAWNLLEN